MAITQLEKFENPGTLTKLSSHVAPLLNWESSRPAERAVAVSKVVGTLAATTGSADLALHAASAVPYLDAGLVTVGASSVLIGAATVTLHHSGLSAAAIRGAVIRFAVIETAAAGIGGGVGIATHTGAVVDRFANSAGITASIAVSAAAVSYGWSRVARREARTAAAPSLADF